MINIIHFNTSNLVCCAFKYSNRRHTQILLNAERFHSLKGSPLHITLNIRRSLHHARNYFKRSDNEPNTAAPQNTNDASSYSDPETDTRQSSLNAQGHREPPLFMGEINIEDPIVIPPISPRIDSWDMYPAESWLSAEELKRRRKVSARRTIFSAIRLFYADHWLFRISQHRILVLYMISTTLLLLGYYFWPKQKFEFPELTYNLEDQEKVSEIMRKDLGLGSNPCFADPATTEHPFSPPNDNQANYPIFVLILRAFGYWASSFIVAIHSLKTLCRSNVFSEDEKFASLSDPLSLMEHLKEDELHHVPYLRDMLIEGRFPSKPWRGVLPPSPWAPHLTLMIDARLLYTINRDSAGKLHLRKRPYADYLLSQMHSCSEIIITSEYHSKSTASQFFALFDPYGLASHYITKEEHRWSTWSLLKPLSEAHLGRRSDRLIVLDTGYRMCGGNCDNVLRVSQWPGNDDDTTLFDLVPLLKYASASIEDGVDVRQLIKRYEGNTTFFGRMLMHDRAISLDTKHFKEMKDRIMGSFFESDRGRTPNKIPNSFGSEQQNTGNVLDEHNSFGKPNNHLEIDETSLQELTDTTQNTISHIYRTQA